MKVSLSDKCILAQSLAGDKPEFYPIMSLSNQVRPESTARKKIAKIKITEKTVFVSLNKSSRLGQVTLRISSRTPRKNCMLFSLPTSFLYVMYVYYNAYNTFLILIFHQKCLQLLLVRNNCVAHTPYRLIFFFSISWQRPPLLALSHYIVINEGLQLYLLSILIASFSFSYSRAKDICLFS